MSDELTYTYPLSAIEKRNKEAEDKDKKIFELEGELARLRQEHAHLQQIYNKLADQWNVFQSLNKPDNRNIQRAEGAGEMARKLAEVLLGVAYVKDTREILRKLLEDLDAPAGQEVEVGGKLVRRGE